MTRGILISSAVVMLALGCRSRPAQTNTGAPEATSAQLQRNTTPSGRERDSASSAASTQIVTLIGCLQGPSLRTVGTSGAARTATGEVQQPDGTSSERLMLADARAVSPESAGVGANGAGGSGGPLVSGKSSFELDGIPAEARAYVNKQVSITGRIDANPAFTSTSASGSNGSSTRSESERASMTADSVQRPVGTRRLRVETVRLAAENCPDM